MATNWLDEVHRLTAWRFLALLLGALALTMTSAHVLELPQKMAYSPEMYAAVNTTLYRYFAIVGGAYQVSALVAAGILALVQRREGLPSRWSVIGFVLLLLAFGSWVVLVMPVNRQVAAAMASSPQAIATLWRQLRNRWEYGHAVGFALQLAGFCAVSLSVVLERHHN